MFLFLWMCDFVYDPEVCVCLCGFVYGPNAYFTSLGNLVDHIGCQGFNLGWPHARQDALLLHIQSIYLNKSILIY